MAASCHVNVNVATNFSRLLTEDLCQEHLQVLKTFTTSLRDKQFGESVEEETFSDLSRVLSRLYDDLQTSIAADREPPSVVLQLLAECFRCQRNACVQNTRNQDMIRKLGVIDISLKLLNLLLSKSLESRYEPLRCGIQFLGNVAVGNQMCKNDIWQRSNPNLFHLLNVDDAKAVDYASMVLHTCLDEAKVVELSKPQNIRVALRVMELCRTHPDLDWMLFIATQHFIKSSVLMERMYSEMCHHERVSLLELVLAQLQEEGSECGIAPGVARFLADSFQTNCGAVLKLSAEPRVADDEQEALIALSLLDVLCEMTSGLREFLFLQDHPELLGATVELLEQVHAVGKASKNVFSSVQNFSSSGDSSSHSPVIGFKAQLIRLIGNLCHKHPNNQNKVGELEGIPLILDNCRIDSNNPFICQWAIFAIRNLLENNKQNQELVASLERQGRADYSALRELGLEVEERDGSLLLKPVRKDS